MNYGRGETLYWPETYIFWAACKQNISRIIKRPQKAWLKHYMTKKKKAAAAARHPLAQALILQAFIYLSVHIKSLQMPFGRQNNCSSGLLWGWPQLCVFKGEETGPSDSLRGIKAVTLCRVHSLICIFLSNIQNIYVRMSFLQVNAAIVGWHKQTDAKAIKPVW